MHMVVRAVLPFESLSVTLPTYLIMEVSRKEVVLQEGKKEETILLFRPQAVLNSDDTTASVLSIAIALAALKNTSRIP